ncbi:hypothetical protein [Sphingomonas elodea]|nr:hypothetical protein [Sphingomonas elodea]
MFRVAWTVLAAMLLPEIAFAQSPQQSAQQSTGSAGEQPAPTGDPIIVTGRPLPSKEEIRALARDVTPPSTSSEPLARFHDSVCFGSVGLDRDTLIGIGDRLAADAELAGLKLAGEGCKPNVVILFVDGVAAEVDKLVRRKWWVFGDRLPSEIRTIVEERGPVRAWSNSEVRSSDGDRVDAQGFLKVTTASRIVASTRRDTLASVVLIERSAIVGKTISQIADYVAMRALAGARPHRAGGRETILALFDGATERTPPELTSFDRGYLRGLYTGPANDFAGTSQSKIVRAILKAKDEEIARTAGK